MDKISLLFRKIALVVTFVIFGGILLSRLFVTAEFLPFYNSISAAFLYRFFDFLCIVAIPVVVVLSNYLNHRFSFTNHLLVFIVGSCLLFTLSSLIFDFTQAEADAHIVYELAKYGVDFNHDYLVQYPYQYGFILFLRLFSLFGSFDKQAYVFFNLLLYFYAVLYTSKTALILASKFSNSTASSYNVLILQFLWVIPLILIQYIYGFAVGLSLCHIALYFYIDWCERPKSTKSLVICWILIFVATVLKMNYVMVGLAITVHQVFINKRIILKVCIVGVGILVLVFQNLIHPIMINFIEKESMPNRIPISAWLLTGGMQEGIDSINVFDWTLPGHFNGYTALLDLVNNSKADIASEVNADIKNELSYMIENPVHTLKYYRDKVTLTWNTSDLLVTAFAFDPSFDQNTLTPIQSWFVNDGYPIFFEIGNIGVFLILFTFLIGLFSLRNNESVYVFPILLVGVFVYHLLFETKAMYVYPYIAMMVPVSACGLSYLTEWFKQFKERTSQTTKIYCIGGFIALLGVISLIYNPVTQLDPVYESYTTADVPVSLEQYKYYRIPFELKSSMEVNGFEIQLKREETTEAMVQTIYGNLISSDGTILDSFTISTEQIPSYYWTRILCEWHLSQGEYYIELFTKEDTDISLIGGLVYGDAKDLLIDNYPLQGISADLKLLSYHTYPINFYGLDHIELVNFMSWQTYAAEAYE